MCVQIGARDPRSVRILTLNRPAALNAADAALHGRLARVWAELAADDGAATSLDRLEARGTIRLALKAAGLDARNVTPGQMSMVVDKLLSRELKARGTENGDAVCATVKARLVEVKTSHVADTPEAVFARLGGG